MATSRYADGSRGDAVETLSAVVAVIAVVGWAYYSFLYAPSHAEGPIDRSVASAAQREIRAELVRRAVVSGFSAEAARVERLKGGNLDVYISAQDFERIPFPDRSGLVDQVGGLWCERVELKFLPVLRIRDIRSGRTVGKYGCAYHRLWGRWWSREVELGVVVRPS